MVEEGSFPPRVFITYSHDDEAHTQRILTFANRLRSDGIDARIDQFTPNPPEGWDYWMERQIFEADAIIAIVTPIWARRFDNREPNSKAGKGVSHEARILRSLLYHKKGDQTGLLVTTVDDISSMDDVPVLLNRHTVFRYPSGYDTIHNEILGENAAPMAPLGQKPILSPKGFQAPPEGPPSIPTEQIYQFTRPAEGDRFVGRTAKILEIRRHIERGNCVSIVGDSQIGKSSLLREIHRQWLEFPGAKESVRLLSGENAEALDAHAFTAAITGRQVPGEGADAAANHLETWVRNCASRPVIFVDEFERVVEGTDQRFFSRLRGMFQDGMLVFVTVSRRALSELFTSRGKTSPFSNAMAAMILGLLSESEAQEIISWGGFDSDLRIAIRHWAGCHPCHLQVFGSHAHLRREPDIPAIINDYAVDGHQRLEVVWRELGDLDQADVLAAIQKTRSITRRSAVNRGVLTPKHKPFGQILIDWLQERGKV